MIVLIAWLKVRNLPKIDKGKKKNKEKETGKALESRLQEEREERSNGSRKSAGSSSKDLATVSEEDHD